MSNAAGGARACLAPSTEEPPDSAAQESFHAAMIAAQAEAGKHAALLAMLCRSNAPPGELESAARAIVASAGLLAGFARLANRPN